MRHSEMSKLIKITDFYLCEFKIYSVSQHVRNIKILHLCVFARNLLFSEQTQHCIIFFHFNFFRKYNDKKRKI